MTLEIKRNVTNATSLRFISIKYKKYISSVLVKIDARKTSQNVHMKPYTHLYGDATNTGEVFQNLENLQCSSSTKALAIGFCNIITCGAP